MALGARERTICRRHSVSILLETKADAELELWAARLKGDMFRQTFRRELHLTATKARK